MSIFAIGDLHLSNAPGSDKPMDVFGNRWFNHAERIRESWQKNVTDRDTVLVAGDISWGLRLDEAVHDLDWIDSLPGHKVLLKGNHDLWWTGITKLNSMYESMTFMQYDSFETEGVRLCGSRGWITPGDDDFSQADEKIYRRELLRLEASLSGVPDGQEKIGFLHFPPAAGRESYSGFMQLFEDYGVKEVYYGHVHGTEGFRNAMIGNFHGIEYKLISADYLNCRLLKIR